MTIDLKNKIALVTGATGQLGRVIACTLAECGADVAIHYHKNKEKADLLVKEIEKMGCRALAVQADITDKSSVEKMRGAVAAGLGCPHIVINNAVSQYEWTTILEQPEKDFIDQFETSTLNNVYMAKAFLPAMAERKSGRFIGINTETAMVLHAGSGAYAAAKRGMDGIYRVLAREMGVHNITVNQVAPGWTVTEKDRDAGTERVPEYEQKIPLGRRGTDREIANVVAFLASDLSSFITGAYIPVCGGQVMPTI